MIIFEKYKTPRTLARRFLSWMMRSIPQDSGRVLTWCYETVSHFCYVLEELDFATWVKNGGDQDGTLGWLCWCGHWQDDGLHCSTCGGESPQGCDCGYCSERRYEADEALYDWNDGSCDAEDHDLTLRVKEDSTLAGDFV